MNNTINLSKLLVKNRRNQENFKTVKTNIEFADNSPKVILVTSSIPSEGKSSVSLNLAASFAENGKRVLLLDCDLRKSAYSKKLNIKEEENIGFTEVLKGTAPLKDSVHSTDVENLYFLLAGHCPSNPTALLSSKHVGKCMDEFKKVFDYVIIDSAPLASVIDSAILCKLCDGVAFVVGSGMVNRSVVQKTIRQIERAGGNIIGIIVNKINMSNRALYGTYGKNKYYVY